MHSLIKCLTLGFETRVRTSEGDASFLFPHVVEVKETVEIEVEVGKGKNHATKTGTKELTRSEIHLEPLGNDYNGKWATLPAGTKLVVCAAYEKTDTWCLAVFLPGDDAPKGMVLRRMCFDKVKRASTDGVIPAGSVTQDTPAPTQSEPTPPVETEIAVIGEAQTEPEAAPQEQTEQTVVAEEQGAEESNPDQAPTAEENIDSLLSE